MKKLTIAFLGCILFLQACRQDNPLDIDDVPEQDFTTVNELDSRVAMDWMDLLTEVERYTPGYRPPTAARTLAYVSLAAYESLVPGMEHYHSVQTEFENLEIPETEPDATYNWELVLNACYETSVEKYYPTTPTEQQSDILQLARKWKTILEEEEENPAVVQRSIDYGRAVAEAVYQWSTLDEVGHESYLQPTDPSYDPPEGPGLWQPTYPDFTPALFPHFGEVRTFAAGSDDKVRDPLPYSESENSQLYAQALETMVIVNEIKAGGRYEDKWIAQFWSDDCPILTFTPAGRWIAIATQVIERNNVQLGKALYTYAKVSIALSDAGVRCWAEKYRFNYLRPIDYIREVMGEEDWNTIMCPDGSGQFFTPNFPTYPSGHATFGGAAAEVLTDIYGNHFPFTDRCHEGRTEFKGTPRSFQSFQEMAEENAYSRIPIGVHFRMDSEAGIELGRKVGRKVNQMRWH